MGTLNRLQMHYVEILCEAVLYGVFCVLIAIVVWLLMSSRKIRGAHKALFYLSLAMFALVTLQLGFEMQQVTRGDDVPLYNIQAQAITIGVLIATGDSILIWRVWVVWGRNYWIAVPSFLMALLTFALSCVGVANITNISWTLIVPKFSEAVSALIVANTVISTSLIIGRVLYIQYQTRGVSKLSSSRPTRSPYTGALLLIAESGAVWTVCQILSLVLGQTHNNGVSTVLDLQVPLVGIMPTTIILLVYFDLVPGSHANDEYMSTIRSGFQVTSGTGSGQVSTLKASRSHLQMTTGSYDLEPWRAAGGSQLDGQEKPNHLDQV